MATAVAVKGPKELTFSWEGKDKAGKVIRGELRAASEAAVNATLRRQGIVVQKVKAVRRKRGGRVSEKDIALFTRQLATMMKAGVPLLQSFDIVGKGASNPAVAKLLLDIRTDETDRARCTRRERTRRDHVDAMAPLAPRFERERARVGFERGLRRRHPAAVARHGALARHVRERHERKIGRAHV